MSNRLQNTKVAARYARALFDSLTEPDAFDAVAADLGVVAHVLAATPLVENYFANPGVSMTAKKALVEEQLTPSVNPRVAQLLRIMVENGRMPIFPLLVTHFNRLLHERDNVAEAEVITAVELEDELRARLRKALESAFGYSQVQLWHRVDPGLLGGVVVKIRDQVIDGSYVGRLEELRKQISNL